MQSSKQGALVINYQSPQYLHILPQHTDQVFSKVSFPSFYGAINLSVGYLLVFYTQYEIWRLHSEVVVMKQEGTGMLTSIMC